MQTISSYQSTSNTLQEYSWSLEREYRPSTFKFVRAGSFLEGVFGWFLPWEERTKEKDIRLYLSERDDVIDEKSIENDLAVVSNDFLISLKRYGKDGTVS